MTASGRGLDAVRRRVQAVFAALDWSALADVYCDFGGERFWRERRGDAETMGLDLARRLLPRLRRGGRSLWVGAGVAELPVMLAEIELHERRVVAASLRARECEVLNAALSAVAPELSLRYLAEDAAGAAAGTAFDHLGCISVFTDPETWPVLSDVTYGRVPPVQLDVERFATERTAARLLATRLFARLARPAVVTTTAEEVAWFLEQATAADATVEAGDELVPTAVVGDPVGFLAIG